MSGEEGSRRGSDGLVAEILVEERLAGIAWKVKQGMARTMGGRVLPRKYPRKEQRHHASEGLQTKIGSS